MVRDGLESGAAHQGQAAQEEVGLVSLFFLFLRISSDASRCRLKELREGPYTHEEAAAAVNYRIDNGPGRTKSQEVEMSS